MAERARKFLNDLLLLPGNDTCADCGVNDPDWASYNLGIFVCKDCAGIHRSLGVNISKVKSVKLDNWDEDQLKFMESQGNLKVKERFERQVPPSYRTPTHKDPIVLREQWIRAKYERLEFSNPEQLTYLSGMKEGFLMKQGKDDRKFNKRKFVLNENKGILQYFTKDDAKSQPKCVLRLDDTTVTLVPEKVGNPNGMQVMWEQGGHTRSIYLYTEKAKDLVDWYNAIRASKLNRLRIAYPGKDDSELVVLLNRDFLKEGWLSKTGPKQSDAYRKRWVSLERRKLMYYEHPLDAYPKGEIFLGSKDRGFAVRDGVPPGMKDPGFCFTLKTPDRHFHFSAETQEDQEDWISILKSILEQPLSPQDSSSMFRK